MALEQDDCSLCKKAEQDLKLVSGKLKCLHRSEMNFSFWRKKCELLPVISEPILLQVLKRPQIILTFLVNKMVKSILHIQICTHLHIEVQNVNKMFVYITDLAASLRNKSSKFC